MHACTLMPQEMLRMCNKGLFAGVGLSGLKLHCFYDILRLYSYGWTQWRKLCEILGGASAEGTSFLGGSGGMPPPENF